MPKPKPEFTPLTMLAEAAAIGDDIRKELAVSRVVALAESRTSADAPVTVGVLVYMRMADGVQGEPDEVLETTRDLMQRLLDTMGDSVLRRALGVLLDAAEARGRAARQ